MAHVNLYLPDDVAESLKKDAKIAQLPLSRHILLLLTDSRLNDEWPPGYFENVCGFLAADEDVLEPPDMLPEPVPDLG